MHEMGTKKKWEILEFAVIIFPDSLSGGVGIGLKIPLFELADGDVEAGTEVNCDAELGFGLVYGWR